MKLSSRFGHNAHALRSRTPLTTRAVAGIDSSVKVNRALWMLAEEMRRLKA